MTVKYKPEPARALRGEPDTDAPSASGDAKRLDRTEPIPHETGSVLVCRVCRSRITRRDLGMEVHGSHRHVFFNPHGQVFELGCFASAKNILPTGPKTGEFTWFSGFDWQAVACTGCITHLGWRYTGSHGGFFGLILASLIEEPGIKP
ncbi:MULTISPECIES: cereblon family protein [unclassified Pseudodesulfovibrio]|uniref:cereblon family protein n=1 Tax=unclassified Pseudodesulfovibrio TaxID=2661612 RepID=UPI000FEB920A|nr:MULTISPECIES: cereblon family protein [unclassified Pseudodesulfovibrio]MCJ2166002.1 cereblon family protein [Pseudodesulfovibrio sp. S3-i]RWU02561.1 hypothetical protein DWB63_15370 [Pseudodesulfovibrio sp. S3]